MFSLLQGLLKWLFSKNEVHILVLGLDAAGKTTFLEQSKVIMRKKPGGQGVPLDRIPPTVGLNIARIDVDNTRVIMWDLGGQTLLRSIWAKYYSEANGLIFVVDSCSPTDRFEEAKETLHALLAHPDLNRIPFLLCANKQDSISAATSEDVEKSMEFVSGCSGQQRTYRVQPMSALTGQGIEDALRWIVQAAEALGPRIPPLPSPV
jgi:ADP-ribosylation factor related protein 1